MVRELRNAGSFPQTLVDFIITGARSRVVIRHCLRILRIQSELPELALASDPFRKLACRRLSKQLAVRSGFHLGFRPGNPSVTGRLVRLAEG